MSLYVRFPAIVSYVQTASCKALLCNEGDRKEILTIAFTCFRGQWCFLPSARLFHQEKVKDNVPLFYWVLTPFMNVIRPLRLALQLVHCIVSAIIPPFFAHQETRTTGPKAQPASICYSQCSSNMKTNHLLWCPKHWMSEHNSVEL